MKSMHGYDDMTHEIKFLMSVPEISLMPNENFSFVGSV